MALQAEKEKQYAVTEMLGDSDESRNKGATFFDPKLMERSYNSGDIYDLDMVRKAQLEWELKDGYVAFWVDQQGDIANSTQQEAAVS